VASTVHQSMTWRALFISPYTLAVSSALGSGLFITTVILGAVILQSSTQVTVKPHAYQRDVLAYLGAVVLIGAVLLGRN